MYGLVLLKNKAAINISERGAKELGAISISERGAK